MDWLLHVVFPNGLLTEPFMFHALISGTAVAILAGLTGFFVILRGSSFVAHALPKVGFAGAAGAVLLEINPLVGLIGFAVAGALSIGLLGKSGRHDVVTALTLVAALGAGALFLSLNSSYATGAYALLFGQLVGISIDQMFETLTLGIICISALALLYRRLLFASLLPDNAKARGIRIGFLEMTFLVIVGLVTAVTVPVVGALLSFSLMIGPAATARYLTHQPMKTLLYTALISVATIWVSLILGYDTSWPIGFFVSTITALCYGSVRVIVHLRERHTWRAAQEIRSSVESLAARDE